MKRVVISSIGSCNTGSRQGFYEVLLEYRENYRYMKRELSNTTANRCIIQGLIDGVEQLKEPCFVSLVTATKIGVSGLVKGKGPNVGLLKELMTFLADKECQFELLELEGQGEKLKRKIRKSLYRRG